MESVVTTPAGKFRVASACTYQIMMSYKVCADIAEIKGEARDLRETEKDLFKIKETGERVGNVLESVLSKLTEDSQINSLLKSFHTLHELVEAVVTEIENIPQSSEKSIYKKLLPALEEILAQTHSQASLIETRLANIVYKGLIEEAASIERRDKDKISEPDEETWEELRKLGDEAQYFTWEVIKNQE